jgi:hypothetical protein
VIELTRALQVKPDAAMNVSFKARREAPAQVKRDWLWGAGLAVLLLLLMWADRALAKWRRTAQTRKPDAAADSAATPGAETDAGAGAG